MFPNVLICTSDGHPQHWATWQDSAVLAAKECISWSYGENEYTLHGGISRMTGEQSTLVIPSIIGVKAKFSPRSRKVALCSNTLFGRDRHICAYCGRLCTGDKATMDHIIPSSKGGKHDWMNIVTACKSCNNHKGDKTLKQAEMELIYVPYEPTREEALILRNRNILGDQMQFLQQFLPSHSRIKQ